jgi:hypothetical protein
VRLPSLSAHAHARRQADRIDSLLTTLLLLKICFENRSRPTVDRSSLAILQATDQLPTVNLICILKLFWVNKNGPTSIGPSPHLYVPADQSVATPASSLLAAYRVPIVFLRDRPISGRSITIPT